MKEELMKMQIKLVRRFIAKGKEIEDYSEGQIREINNMPCKVLDGQTGEEVYRKR
ncbi:hypothetical protein [Catonella sp.]|uniref:hypothetical protein n=1 Tax=Catonella sp. TaxID=2382125 RepID=UPI003FA114BC